MAAASTTGWMNWVSIAALGVSIVALVGSLAIPGPLGAPGAPGAVGPTGLTGSTGPQGPLGFGTLVASDGNLGGNQILTSTCANYVGSAVTITVPGAGTVIVTGSASIQITHATGQADQGLLFLDTSATSCVVDEYTTSFLTMFPAQFAVETHTHFVQKPFVIAAAGTHTFYLNAFMEEGSGNDIIFGSSLIAVFYPA